jgi:hypothetical protein
VLNCNYKVRKTYALAAVYTCRIILGHDEFGRATLEIGEYEFLALKGQPVAQPSRTGIRTKTNNRYKSHLAPHSVLP